MVQTTNFGNLHDLTHRWPLDRPHIRRLLLERQVSSCPVVVHEVAGQDAAQVTFAQDKDMIQTLAPDRADKPLYEGVLPWALGRCQHFPDFHALHSLQKRVTVDRVTIAEEVGRRGVVRERLHDLLGGPGGGGMLGRVEVNDTPPMVGEDDQDEEDAQVSGGNGEEGDRDQVSDMVSEERAPGLRRWCASLGDEPGDGTLGHVDAQLEQLAMDSGGAPQAIGGGHSRDQGADFSVDRRAASGRPAGTRGPVLAETAPLPPQNGIGRHDDESLPPAGPDSGQPDPQQAVDRAQPRPGRHSLVDGELLAQGQVFEGELTMAADEEGEEPKQVEHKGDHEPRLWPDGADRSTTWLRDEVLARDRFCHGLEGAVRISPIPMPFTRCRNA